MYIFRNLGYFLSCPSLGCLEQGRRTRISFQYLTANGFDILQLGDGTVTQDPESASSLDENEVKEAGVVVESHSKEIHLRLLGCLIPQLI